jgi:hypothetical protein
VEDHVDPTARGDGGLAVTNVALDGPNAQRVELPVTPPAERSDLVPASHELLDDVQSEEAPGPGY